MSPQGGFRGPTGFLHFAPEGMPFSPFPEQGPRQLRHHPRKAHSPAEMPTVSHGVGAGGAELGAHPRGVVGVDGVWRGHAGPADDRGGCSPVSPGVYSQPFASSKAGASGSAWGRALGSQQNLPCPMGVTG